MTLAKQTLLAESAVQIPRRICNLSHEATEIECDSHAYGQIILKRVIHMSMVKLYMVSVRHLVVVFVI